MSNTSNIYDKSIGSRIRSCRKSSSCCTQASLSEYLGIHPDTLRKWERDESVPEMFYIMKMCELFQCDHGFLLCEHDSKYYGSENLSAHLGLSPAAVDNLLAANKSGNPYVQVLSAMLEDESILSDLSLIAFTDYGNISSFYDVDDPFTGNRFSRMITPDMMKDVDCRNLYISLIKFIEDFQKNKKE